MLREIVKIDDEKCNGCGLCIPNCPEGAIQIINGKARLVSDLFCDGLGACLGHCPEGAIEIEKREAEPYNERKAMDNIVPQGADVVFAHLKHLQDHGENKFLKEALLFMKEKNIQIPKGLDDHGATEGQSPCGCPGAKTMTFKKDISDTEDGKRPSHLAQWPIQLHLVSPSAPYYTNADLLLAADCVAFALGDFHKDYLKGKALAIACPKLDDGQEVYLEKLKAMIDEAKINTITVMIMQVACCGGLLHLAKEAVSQSRRKVPVKSVIVGLEGEILKEEWV
ncbi:MAG: 4Fe-4S binding protein [Deltaproteobacteria bacterium]|nr:4Fe-4S binding protein [Deltaproteobacteria bacterium]